MTDARNLRAKAATTLDYLLFCSLAVLVSACAPTQHPQATLRKYIDMTPDEIRRDIQVNPMKQQGNDNVVVLTPLLELFTPHYKATRLMAIELPDDPGTAVHEAELTIRYGDRLPRLYEKVVPIRPMDWGEVELYAIPIKTTADCPDGIEPDGSVTCQFTEVVRIELPEDLVLKSTEEGESLYIAVRNTYGFSDSRTVSLPRKFMIAYVDAYNEWQSK